MDWSVIKKITFCAAVGFSLFNLSRPEVARADVRSTYGGMGSLHPGLAGADRSVGSDGFSMSQNPTLMSDLKAVTASVGLLYAKGLFEDLQNIVIDNTNIGGSSVVTGIASTSLPDTFLLEAGLIVPIYNNEHAWRLGIDVSTPLDKLAEFSNQDWYRPQYSVYVGDAQKFTAEIGISMKPSPDFSFGVGGQLYFTTGMTMIARMPQAPATSTFSLRGIIRPGIAPSVGIKYQLQEKSHFTIGFLGARDYRTDLDVNSYIYLLSSPLPLQLHGSTHFFYDPETWSIGYSYAGDSMEFHSAVDLERWSPFDGLVFKTTIQNFASIIQNSESSRFKDIVVPRLGLNWKASDSAQWRFGYAYRPVATPDLTGPTNFMDAEKHILGLGFGYKWKPEANFLGAPFRIDSHLQYHYLKPRDVVKTDSTAIGAPGYTVKGSVIGAGLEITIEI